jgi:vacuolar-type H+-ATPase subunit H
MTEIDELKVIRDRENAKKKAIQDLKDEMERQLAEKIKECDEKSKNVENQIINDYNKGLEEIKEAENKKMIDALDTQKARAQVMKVDLKEREMEEMVYETILKYIKQSD